MRTISHNAVEHEIERQIGGENGRRSNRKPAQVRITKRKGEIAEEPVSSPGSPGW